MTNLKNKIEHVEYQNWSCNVFDGFYESMLFNSDTLYNLTCNDKGECLKDDEEYDIKDFDAFQKDVCIGATDLITDLVADEDILTNLVFRGVSSPTYYNYSTDKLQIDMDVDTEKLETFCFKTNRDAFSKYLKDNFTSYDGFISFIPNSVPEFAIELRDGDSVEHGRCMDTMIEYYILTKINNTTNSDLFDRDNSYHYSLYELADECVWNHIEVVKI